MAAANHSGSPWAAPALRQSTQGCGLIEIAGQENALTDVLLAASPGIGVRSLAASGLHLRRVNIRPEGDQLISTGADGVYLIGLRRGATVEDSPFEGLADDGLNNHASASALPAATADRWIAWDAARVLKTSLPSANPAGACSDPGCRGFNISASGEGLRVRGNTYRNLRGFGVRNDAGQSLISRNAFTNVFSSVDSSTSAWGRYLDSETDLDGEGPYAYNFIARNNCVRATWTYFGGTPLVQGYFFDWETWAGDPAQPANFRQGVPTPTLAADTSGCPW